MKQYQINKAFLALRKLSGQKLPFRKALGIYNLINALEPQYNFAVDEEKKLINQYNGNIEEGGMVVFEKNEDMNSFRKEIESLNDMEIDLKFNSVSLSDFDMEGLIISPSDIHDLEGFVAFE